MSTSGPEPEPTGPVEALALELRALWVQAGKPSSRALARSGSFSHTTVAEAISGKRVPSWTTFRSIVVALGGSEEHFRSLWATASTLPAPKSADMPTTQAAERPEARLRQVGRDTPSSNLTTRQLPADVFGFTGRTEPLSQLDRLLDQAVSQPALVTPAVLGTAGVGKTALAVHWAQRVRDRFPDGDLYVDLRGYGPAAPVQPANALDGLLRALGVEPTAIPPQADDRAALYRSLLHGRRMLIVLDNARSADQVRPLLPGTSSCFVIVTSRDTLASLVARDGVRPIILDLLTDTEARELLAQRLGATRVAEDPAAVDEIIARCAGLPLALVLAAARAAVHPKLSLATTAGELRDSQDGLDSVAGGDPTADITAVFSWSYQALTPAAARLFRLLSLHPGPDLSAPAAASLAGLPPSELRPLLAELVRAHLISEPAAGRYAMHDLLRSYATDLAYAHDSDNERRVTIHRLLDHYLRTADAANQLLSPYENRVKPPTTTPGVTAEHMSEPRHALTWFIAERRVLVAAIHQAIDTGFDNHAIQLATAMETYLHRQGHWQDWQAVQQAALNAVHRQGSQTDEATAHRSLAYAAIRLGSYDDARSHLRQALGLYDSLNDHLGRACIHLLLCLVNDRQGRLADALNHAEEALVLYQTAGHTPGQADALNTIGWCHTRLGNHLEALSYGQKALTLLEELSDHHSQAAVWGSLGYIHHQLGRYTEATSSYQSAVGLYRDTGDLYNEAATFAHLGDTYAAANAVDKARRAWQRALNIFKDLDYSDAIQVGELLRRLEHGPIGLDKANETTTSTQR